MTKSNLYPLIKDGRIARMSGRVFNKWVKALRSGKFEQTKAMLYEIVYGSEGMKPGFCCLGVLGVVVGIPTEELEGYAMLNDVKESLVSEEARTQDLSGIQIKYGLQQACSIMNDKGLSFKEIATWLEKHRDRIVDRK